MAIDMFLKVEGASGESKDSNHKGWTDITSFSWGASQPGNMGVGGGGGAGKVCFNDLHVNALIDKSTPALLKHCSSGKHLTKIELSVCKAGGSQVEYAKSPWKTCWSPPCSTQAQAAKTPLASPIPSRRRK